jgi:hypothetical protein
LWLAAKFRDAVRTVLIPRYMIGPTCSERSVSGWHFVVPPSTMWIAL